LFVLVGVCLADKEDDENRGGNQFVATFRQVVPIIVYLYQIKKNIKK